MKERSLAAMACGAIVGLALALQVLEPGFILGTGGKWRMPENDYFAYLVAWRYYIVDEWRFPLFSLPAMGYPEGGSVLFNDALPFAMLVSRLLYRLTGTAVNPFGWWILLTYTLQGAMAARIVHAAGVRSALGWLAAAVLGIVNASFIARMGHTALSSHFLLLWVMALYVESVRRERPKVAELTAVLALTLLVNAYLFVMVFAFAVVTLLTLGWRGGLRRRDLTNVAGGLLLVAALGMLAGYGPVLLNPSSMQSEGFGLYSWNLVSLLLPPDGLFGLLRVVPRYGTHGQYEGEAYVGRGALLLLASCVALGPRFVLDRVRRHSLYAATVAAFAVVAATNVVYTGGTLVLHYDLPQRVLDIANAFRATGRFIWPLAYSLAILPLAAIVLSWRRLPALLVVALAVCLQLHEARGELNYRRQLTARANADLIDVARVNAWLAAHERFWQYPSWACGGLAGPTRRWASRESNQELQLQLAVARLGLPTNSVYTSRVLKDCDREVEWQAEPRLERGTLYVLSPVAVRSSPRLSALATSPACITLEWAVVCSQAWWSPSGSAEKSRATYSRTVWSALPR